MADKHELHEKGLRLTPQRELVLQAVRDLGHATPEEVAEVERAAEQFLAECHALFDFFNTKAVYYEKDAI